MEPQESQQPVLDSIKSKIKRFQRVWRVFLISTLGLAAYMFATARKKNMNIPDDKIAKKVEEEEKKPSEEEDLSDYTLWEPEFSSA